MTPVVDTDLFEYALINPALAAKPADELFIVSGYASHALASGHISVLKAKSKAVNIDLIYGMAGEGVSDVDYLGFKSLHNHAEYAYDGSFDCRPPFAAACALSTASRLRNCSSRTSRYWPIQAVSASNRAGFRWTGRRWASRLRVTSCACSRT